MRWPILFAIFCGLFALARRLLTFRSTVAPCSTHSRVSSKAESEWRARSDLPTIRLTPTCKVADFDSEIQPFTYRWRSYSKSFVAFHALLFALLAPLRVFIVNGAITTAGVVSWLLLRLFPRNFQGPPRNTIINTFALFVLRTLTQAYIGAIGFWGVKVVGKKAPASEAPILISNHRSFVEGLFLGGLFGLSPVSKAENANMVFMGDILKVLRSVIVDRTSAQSRSDTAAALTERAKSRKWPQILLFPEGTTTNGTCLAQFQLGAFLAGQPIQPVVVTYDGQDIDASLVDDGPDVFPSIFRFMCFLRHPMTVRFLPVYNPSPEEIASPKVFCENVSKMMAKELGVPRTQASYMDVTASYKVDDPSVPLLASFAELAQLKEHCISFEAAFVKHVHGKFIIELKRQNARQLTNGHTGSAGSCDSMCVSIDAEAFAHSICGEAPTVFASRCDGFNVKMRRVFGATCNSNHRMDFRNFLATQLVMHEFGIEGSLEAVKLAATALADESTGMVPLSDVEILLSSTAGRVSTLGSLFGDQSAVSKSTFVGVFSDPEHRNLWLSLRKSLFYC